MNKKQIAILSIGNTSHKDEGIALYASRYLESNYSFQPEVDIIHGDVARKKLLNVFMEYQEIIVLDVITIEDAPGSMYQFPMETFRSFSTNEDDDETGVLGCLNLLERQGETLPKVTLLAIIPQSIESGTGLSSSLLKPFDAYILMIIKSLEDKGISCEEKAEKQTLQNIVADLTS
ncbi:hydrogenase maturation protease [Sulfurimonas sediminis]|uniref:Hydrogenase maturation protease n=1 Tax=Sulfurimonas sediminis TaxID=2590020 RepID=A0A7M1B169_9BACT|nr:hydrogenase maturation protease [Sulfurimonas sediminis]QOP43471.1 hydrogenase maturation protease [Sulfurimonas sediminis]